ncbi:MAG: GC-type dockerin domain-anchored protein [Phycisphaerales bacterium]
MTAPRAIAALFAASALLLAADASGEPIVSTWDVSGPDETVAVAAASLSGWYATADTFEDAVDVRDIRGQLLRTVTRAQITSLLPWMSLDGGPDGPSALAWTDSGRLLFILVHDDTTPGDGLGSDSVLRYDVSTDALTVFLRTELHNSGATHPHLAMLHTHGRLYVGSTANGLRVYRAQRNDTSGAILGTAGPGGGAPIHGLALDRALGKLYAATNEGFYRADIAQVPPVFTRVGNLSGARGIAHTDHFGNDSTRGVYIATDDRRVLHATDLQALGFQAWAPTEYLDAGQEVHDVAATACGRLLVATDEDALLIGDTLDPRLDFDEWLEDEFMQAVTFAKGLVSPDGEPPGWVIDADVAAGGTRFHPATPDAAAWAVLLLLMSDHLYADPQAEPLVAQILERYAGLASDGIGPSVSADGQIRHWIDPATGGAQGSWDPEFATLSTMHIVLAAARARAYYPANPAIREAADAIIGRVTHWDDYIQPGTDALYYRAQPGGGPQPNTAASPFHEGIIFVEQAATFGDSQDAYDHWLDRSLLPSASYLSGQPITSGSAGSYQAAFVSLYPALVQRAYRDSTAWRAQLTNLLASNGAWTDDNAPALMTVFSAGTTAPQWGGYHADSLGSHPGDVTSFPALMAFAATGQTAPAVGAYHAYRHGARELFDTGASLLFRRSNELASYSPPDAGLPDVALGALGLAEIIEPGSIDLVLARAYTEPCPADLAEPFGSLDFSDVVAFLVAFGSQGPSADLAPPLGVWDFSDVIAFLTAFAGGCDIP